MPVPLVSVVISVYNAEQYIREALDSILSQSFAEYEIFLFDDGSSDGTRAILNTYSDKRLMVHSSSCNLGLATQVNKGLDLARGKYIARMDGDDVAHPDRFLRQIKFLEENPEIGICGTFAERFNYDGVSHLWKFPTAHEHIQASLLFRGSFCNPSTMMRREVVEMHSLRYDSDFPPCEDYHMWYRLLKVTRGANLTDVLLRYRLSPTQFTQAKADVKRANLKKLRRVMLRDLDLPTDEDSVTFHEAVVGDDWPNDSKWFKRAVSWMESIALKNKVSGLYSDHALAAALSQHLRFRCQVSSIGREALSSYKSATFTRQFPIPAAVQARIWGKALVW